ncbi:alpha/beta hydrolase [Microlunatus sp. Y2014]|uniref:alpha/beta hydrolase n=1 Tax=Microlunatus sp. Y2014 TaxID=3418488 RepID=UPI003DA6FE89
MTAPRPYVVVAVLFCAIVLSGCSALELPWTDRGPTPPPTTPSGPPSSATPSSGGTTSPTPTPATPTVARSTAPIPDVLPEGFRQPPPGNGLSRYTEQEVDWQNCGQRLECAEIAVPLDHDDPDGVAITLAVKRYDGGSGTQGSIFLNPGGPGGSGYSMPDSYGQFFAGEFDTIGWDPRGVGRSTPVKCFNGADLEKFYELDSTPDDETEERELAEGTRAFTMSCLALSGRLLEHVSTVETVKDLDLMRRVVGDEKLTYLGFSYGTEIGAVYAQLFPQHVGRLVLDSAVNITQNASIIQAQGFDRALGNFAQWCADGNCEFGNSADAVITRITDFLDDLDANPLPVGDRELTQSLGALGVLTPLYQDERVWPYLRTALGQAFAGDGSMLLRYADSYNRRDADGQYGQMLFAFNAVRCLDEGDGGLAGAEQEAAEAAAKAPVFGTHLGPDLMCAMWPVPAREPVGKITGPGAPPILVVGTTGDSATPYEYAEWMAAQLESGVLLTLDGEGHGAFGGPSACINDAVLTYLTTGRTPPEGTVCR